MIGYISHNRILYKHQQHEYRRKGYTVKVAEIRNHMVQAAMDLHERRLWERFTNYDCFGVTWPNLGNPMLGTIMGNAGQEYGLQVLRGPLAYDCLLVLQGFSPDNDDIMDEMDLLGFSMEPYGNTNAEIKGWVRKAGLSCSAKDPIPFFLAKAAGCRVLLPDNKEMHCLLRICRAVLAADDQGLLEPTEINNPKGICWLTLNEDILNPLVSVSQQIWSGPDTIPTISLPKQRPNLSNLPKNNATWLMGWLDSPMGIQGDNRTTKLLLVIDADNEMVLYHNVVFSDQMEDAIFDLFQFMKSGLPCEIFCSSRKLYDATAPILSQVGVHCEFQPDIPLLQDLMDTFYQFMENRAEFE